MRHFSHPILGSTARHWPAFMITVTLLFLPISYDTVALLVS
ncbi:MAG TPA: hypothetical protein VF979_11885 [Streptosporangiaceae bacterium]